MNLDGWIFLLKCIHPPPISPKFHLLRKATDINSIAFCVPDGDPESHQDNAASSIIHLNIEGTSDKGRTVQIALFNLSESPSGGVPGHIVLRNQEIP